jgi:fructan beta-fructosidase
METPEGTKWVLIVSMIVPDHEAEKYTAGNHVTQYYIGDFDGTVFKDTQLSDKVLLLDDGPDFYAGVTFNGTDRPIMMGWADNWCYANDTPAKEEGFQGQMTSARELSLKKCEDGYRVASSILIPFDPKQYVSLPEEKEFKTKLSNCNAVDIHTKITPGGSITFENEEGNVFLLRCTKDSYIIDRTKAGRNNFSPQFAEGAMGVIRIPRKNPNEKQIRLIHDGCLFELEADEGMTTASVCTYPNNPYTQATFSGCTEGMLGYIH